jgi:uncharacterized protein YceH (UPF0502 family)
MSTAESTSGEPRSPRWQPLGAIERRVLGVLIEKAKTTPENYPLSLNSLRSGCNQKSNRAPMMQLEEDQVDEALENLRKLGAVAQIQGGGRVDKYRHLAYEWLGVEKVELAVMAELLLRGTQTVGELRGRAARMEPIKDLSDLQPTLEALHTKGLIIYLSPPGRGSLVTHAMFLEREMDKVRREAGDAALVGAGAEFQARGGDALSSFAPTAGSRESSSFREAENLADEIQQLRDEVSAVKNSLEATRSEFESTAEELRRILVDLNRQPGN